MVSQRLGLISTVCGALAVLAAVALLPSPAHATCGDYVLHGKNMPGMPEHSPVKTQSDVPPNTPCHGPLCSQVPANLPLLPVPPTFEPPASKMALPGERPAVDLDCQVQPIETCLLPTAPLVRDIFHPPRAR